MIAVDFASFVLTVLVIALLSLGGVWIGGEGARHLRERALRRRRLHCPLCGLDFYDESPRELVDCPMCDSSVARRLRRGSAAAAVESAADNEPVAKPPAAS